MRSVLSQKDKEKEHHSSSHHEDIKENVKKFQGESLKM